jgi:plasmid stabilization system protein ParE
LRRRICDAIQNLRRHPQAGRSGIEEGTRELVISPYIVVYRLMDSEAVQILRMWHGGQDWR